VGDDPRAFAHDAMRIQQVAHKQSRKGVSRDAPNTCMCASMFISYLEPNQSEPGVIKYLLATFMMQGPNSHRFASSPLLLLALPRHIT
jgi:hypothetical protein